MQKDPASRYESATEMLKDLNMALKNPEGKFVEENVYHTQRVKTITKEDEEKLNNNNRNDKKENKIISYLKTHPKQKIAIFAVVAVILLILAFFITKNVVDSNTIKNVPIPELVGLTEEEVKTKLQDTKFTYEITSEEYSATVEAGKVISQDPAFRKSYTIKENSNIGIVISKGIEKVVVPKVVGMKYEDAVKELESKKLKAEKIEDKSDKVEEGYVIEQETAENTEANAGDTVKIHVSIGNGLEKVLVPAVIGKSEETAKSELENAKLEVEVVYDEDKTRADGIVLKQSIDVSQVVDEGTTITITVNKIEQIKDGTVNVNLKSLTGYKEPASTNTIPEVPTATVKITVDDKVVYEQKHKKDTTKITKTVQGKGTVEVEVWIDGILEQTKNLDLTSSNPVVSFE